MTDDERSLLRKELEEKYNRFNSGSRLWSAMHHWSLAVAAILSAMAAVTIKINWLRGALPNLYANRDDIVSLLAAAATLITTLALAGGFGRKWQTNRVSRGGIECLRIALTDPQADAVSIRSELQGIIKRHDEIVVGLPVG